MFEEVGYKYLLIYRDWPGLVLESGPVEQGGMFSFFLFKKWLGNPDLCLFGNPKTDEVTDTYLGYDWS